MLNVYSLCYQLALVYADAGEYFQFIKYFETTMIQLCAFLKNLSKRLKIYIKTAKKIQEFPVFLSKAKDHYKCFTFFFEI